MSRLIEELKNLGCNMEETMERFMGNEELYFDCLEKALGDKSFAQLKETLEEKDVKASFEHAHNLKGLMANMGLAPIYDEVVEIMEPLRKGNYNEEMIVHYDRMMKERENFLEISNKYQESL